MLKIEESKSGKQELLKLIQDSHGFDGYSLADSPNSYIYINVEGYIDPSWAMMLVALMTSIPFGFLDYVLLKKKKTINTFKK